MIMPRLGKGLFDKRRHYFFQSFEFDKTGSESFLKFSVNFQFGYAQRVLTDI